ncbi:MAG: aspartate/glutamate racemase family protein [Firmicutes bacterium]|nr:aspartate/glutamate racemase family protein [Bacillota bacterium]
MDNISKKRIGMLTPSSNVIVEPITNYLLSQTPVTAHFSRFPVTHIDLSDTGKVQFDSTPMLAAAQLLADAHVNVIAWNGTSGTWLGLDHDIRLCRAIRDVTDIPAFTFLTAQLALFKHYGIHRIGLITPYRGDVVTAICRNFEDMGLKVVSEQHLGLQDNFSFAEVSSDTLQDLAAHTMMADVQALCIMCTNLLGANVVNTLETQHGVIVFDSVDVVVWGGLQAVGWHNAITDQGRLLLDNPTVDPISFEP